MSRKIGEFKHRTSIFEAAYRAWSQLGGGLEKEDSGGPHVRGRFVYPYQRLPVSGLSHPFIQSILNAWLRPTEDREAGLKTLRIWWSHRRKGPSKSAQRFLSTPAMTQKVNEYTNYFFQIVTCNLLGANNNRNNSIIVNNNNNNNNNNNAENTTYNDSNNYNYDSNNTGDNEQQHVVQQFQHLATVVEPSQKQKNKNLNPNTTTYTTTASKRGRIVDDDHHNIIINNNYLDAILRSDDSFDCWDDETLLDFCHHHPDRKKQKHFQNNNNDEGSIPIIENTPSEQQQQQQQQLQLQQQLLQQQQQIEQPLGTVVVGTTFKDRNVPQTQRRNPYLDVAHFGVCGSSSLGGNMEDWSTLKKLLSMQCHELEIEKDYCAVVGGQQEKKEDSYGCDDVFNRPDYISPLFATNNQYNSSRQEAQSSSLFILPLDPSQEQENDTTTTTNITHSEIWNYYNNMNEDMKSGNMYVHNNKWNNSNNNNNNNCLLLGSITANSSSNVEEHPQNENSSCDIDDDNHYDSNKSSIDKMTITVEGITSIHDVTVIETVLKGCEGNVFPIVGVIDAVVDVPSSKIFIQIDDDHCTTNHSAKDIALVATRNLARMGYTADSIQFGSTTMNIINNN